MRFFSVFYIFVRIFPSDNMRKRLEIGHLSRAIAVKVNVAM
jgi:hypothetical protein